MAGLAANQQSLAKQAQKPQSHSLMVGESPVDLSGLEQDNSDIVDAIIASAESSAYDSQQLKEELVQSRKELAKLTRRISTLENTR